MRKREGTSAISRRKFIQITGWGGSTIILGCLTPFVSSCEQQKSDDLYELFNNPSPETHPFFRWWWNGNRVTKQGVSRELQIMKDAGAGGVEINPIALDDLVDNPAGKPLEWLGNEWMNVLSAATRKAEELDMTVDLIVGTGWPFGGEFLDKSETIKGLEIKTYHISGPDLFLEHYDDIVEDENREILQIKRIPVPLNNVNDIVDITSQMLPNGSVEAEIPGGNYIIHTVILKHTFREVMFGAPGGSGPVLDHYNKAAVEKYLQHMSDKLRAYFDAEPGNFFRTFFCDSIELKGANWTDDLPHEFKKRRGYAIEPYLSLLISKETKMTPELSDTLERVRYDFSKTLSELFTERFILPFHNWCHENGVMSRYQAYGHPWIVTDMIDGYLVPDIPEGDQWLFNRGWVPGAEIDQIRYATFNKYASSGGHLENRKVISCEAMTNTSGVFEASLEYIKQAADINFITGINHFVLHGYNYSPKEAGFPGWIRFGTYFSPYNPWWPYVSLWSDYTARLSALFQEASPVSDIAIFGPVTDNWSKTGLDRNPLILNPWYLHELWQALNHHGYCSDYINGEVLKKATFNYGEIIYGPMKYKALVVVDVSIIEEDVARALESYAKNGGKIIFINTIPSKSAGLNGKDNIIRDIFTAIMAQPGRDIHVVNEPEKNKVTEWAGRIMSDVGIEPSVKFSETDKKLFFTRYTHTDKDIFFFVNSNRNKTLQFGAQFPVAGKSPWKWNPETGEKTACPFEKSRNYLHITLQPLESQLIVYQPGVSEPKRQKKEDRIAEEFEISGPWKVYLKPVIGRQFSVNLEKPVDFAYHDILQNFSGEATYHTSFQPDNQKYTCLDLGDVYETAEVKLNNEPLGVKWWGRKTFNIEDKLTKGINTIEIKVTNLLYNYVRTLKDNPVAQKWTTRGRERKLGNKEIPWALNSGLAGPVKLTFENRSI